MDRGYALKRHLGTLLYGSEIMATGIIFTLRIMYARAELFR
jgi:hypothetical protein